MKVRTPDSRAGRRADAAVEDNARLTAANAAVLMVMLGAEGFTLIRDVGGAGIRQWLTAASLAIRALAGVLVLSRVSPWLAVSGQ